MNHQDRDLETESSANNEILPRVRKPARYIGDEWNIVRKDPAAVRLRMALAFPDVYDVGMSHLGLKILYHIINNRDDLAAERVFAPWPDMEAELRSANKPLATLETGTPLQHFDVVGFSLQYELAATNILQMLDLAGIPLRSVDRGEDDPLVIGGGPVTSNPMPLSPFFDALVIGDGEEIIHEITDVLKREDLRNAPRSERLSALKTIEGVYVPMLHGADETVKRRVVPDLENVAYPAKLVVPYCETVHDRIGIEIARGCTRGCRFCQAGIFYRPVREREPATIMELAEKSLRETGWEQISLLSLSTGDYSHVADLIRSMTARWCDDKVSISLPSLRTETFSEEFADEIKRVRKTGFTLAPEAGTERLRRVINKGNTEADLKSAVEAAFHAGWKSVKLYFMIGLPGETDEDLDGITSLVRKAASWAGRGKITASVSTFVPKSHTPFQWAVQIDMEETRRRQQHIRRYFRKGRTQVKFHDPQSSFLEGVFARGDEHAADAIQRAYELGARFDGWDERFDLSIWMRAFEDTGIDPMSYLRERSLDEPLPWDIIDSGVSKDFLKDEWRRALAEQSTPDCRTGECQDCGVCDFESVYPRVAQSSRFELMPPADRPSGHSEELRRIVVKFAKQRAMRFLGHHDTARTFHRAFRRAGIPLAHSQGFHPQPKVRFSPPIPVGVSSVFEFMEFDTPEPNRSAGELFRLLKGVLPRGLDLLEFKEISLQDSAISGKIGQITYRVTADGILDRHGVSERLETFASRSTVSITRIKKGKPVTRDLKEWITAVDFTTDGFDMTIRFDTGGTVNPLDAAAGILDVSQDEVRELGILKVNVTMERDRDRSGNLAYGLE